MYKVLYALFLAILVGVFIVFGTIWYREYNEYKLYEQQKLKTEAQWMQARKRLEQNQNYVQRFHSDPSFLQWVVRMKLGYIANDELVFRFADEDTAL